MPKFYDELGEASLENLASDPSNLPEGRVWKNSTSQLPKVAIGGAVKELITNDATQTLSNKTISGASNTITNVSGSNVVNTPSGNLAATDVQAALNELQSDIDTRATSSALTTHTSATTSVHGIADTADLLTTSNAKVVTNKDIDGGTASNTNRVTIPKDTLANLQALTRKEGTIVYATDTDKFYSDNGTSLVPVGAGSGLKNYFTDGDAEGSNPFTLFNDGAAIWVDGTGGSPTATITQSATTPLAGQKSFLFTSGTQYDTAKASVTIDREDKYKVIVLEVAYETASGTYADGDLQLFVYDSTNSAILYASPVSNLLASGVNAKQQFAFQASDSLSYQILIHQKTSATFSMRFEMKFSPQLSLGYAPISTDPEELDASAGVFIKAVTTDPAYGTVVRNEGRYSNNAGMTYYTWEYEQSDNTGASNGSGTYLIKLPYKMDLTKYGLAQNFTDTGLTQSVTVDGDGSAYYAGGDNIYRAVFYVYDEQHLAVLLRSTTGTYNWWSSSFFQFSPGAPALKFQYHIKVWTLGLSAETKVISEYDGRVVAAIYEAAIGTAITINTPFQWNTKQIDTHSAVTTGATWKFTAPVAGIYRVSFVMYLAGANTDICLYKNGSLAKVMAYSGTANELVPVGSTLIELNVGDYVDLRPTNAGATITDVGTGSSAKQCVAIELLSGAQQITAGERIIEKGYYPFGTSVTSGTAIGGLTKTFSSHGALNFTSGVFTAPRSDWYRVKFCMNCGATVTPFSIYVNGTQDAELFVSNSGALGGGNDTVYLLADDTLEIRSSVSATSANGGAGGRQYLEIMSGAW